MARGCMAMSVDRWTGATTVCCKNAWPKIYRLNDDGGS